MMQVERVTNHDVKAIEYVLKERFKANAELHKVATPTASSSSTSWMTGCQNVQDHFQPERECFCYLDGTCMTLGSNMKGAICKMLL